MNQESKMWWDVEEAQYPRVNIGQASAWGLSDEEVAFFRSNGYLVVRGRFSAEECDAYLKQIELHANQDFAAVLNPDREEELIRQGPLSSREHSAETSRLFRNILRDPRLVDAVETLQGQEVVGLMSQMLFKKAGSAYAAQAWNPHQDNSYIHSPNGRYMTTNFFMAKADKGNGSIYIYPGSHQEGLLPCKPVISWRESQGTNPGNTVQVPKKYKKIDLEFQKGDYLILHSHAIHGSYPNRSKTRSRPMLSCSYITRGEPFIPGKNAKRMIIPLH